MKHNDKKKVIENLVIVPNKNKRGFWAKEIKCFNEVYKLYPHDSFWQKIKFPDKFESINLLRSGYYAKELKSKYLRFFYTIPEPSTIKFAKVFNDEEVEILGGPKTLRNFLK